MEKYPIIIGNKKVFKKETLPIYDKFTGLLFAEISASDANDVEQAAQIAEKAVKNTDFDIQARYNVLMNIAKLMKDNKEELAHILIEEAGKTVIDAHNEVDWSIDLFIESAEEAKRLNGETFCMPVPWLDTRTCYTRKEPVGVVAAITPFNFPLNLVSHKLAPALAAGNAVILKPAEATSVIGLKLCELIVEAGLPEGYISCLTGSGSIIGPALTANQNISFYSFTGSVPTGKLIKSQIGIRKCALELGSNSATIICDDYDIDSAVSSCIDAAFSNAGQVCIHLQRIYVQNNIYLEFLKKITEESKKIIVGDPSDPKTKVGPMIAEKEAIRAMSWVNEALQQGAIAHCGNRREKSLLWPTVLTNVTPEMKVVKDEIFAPVTSVIPFDNVNDAFDMVNDSRYGLNAGILTNNMPVAMEAIKKIKCGSVIVGGTCGFRFGNMPYGGVKESGFGKEGPHYAINEMSETKTIIILS